MQEDDLRLAERRYYGAVGLPPPESRDLRAAGLRIRIAVLDRSGGVPIVWVHGGGGLGAQLAGLAAVESRAPGVHRHIVVDRPGCGLSESFT
jgi:pimeloyl-ACP methyl ester carboxylesterase